MRPTLDGRACSCLGYPLKKPTSQNFLCFRVGFLVSSHEIVWGWSIYLRATSEFPTETGYELSFIAIAIDEMILSSESEAADFWAMGRPNKTLDLTQTECRLSF